MRRRKRRIHRGPRHAGVGRGLKQHARVADAPASDGPVVPSALVVGVLYAATGAAALVHEVAWTRIARSLLGGDSRAMAVALIAVLGGMGIGGLLAPAVARRWGALGGFARVEAAAAVFAMLLPWVAPVLDSAVGTAFRALGPGTAFTGVSLLIALVLFAPPAIAMGAGLPLLAEARAAAGRTPRDAGALYAAHALGGTVGGLLAAFALVPDLGVPLAVVLAGLLQLGVAATAVVLRRQGAEPPVPAAAPSVGKSPAVASRYLIALLLTAAMLAGIGTAALQALWTRMATLAVGPSVQGFSLVAAVYVLALAVGAGVAAPMARRSNTPVAVYGALVLGAAIATLLGLGPVGAWPEATAAVFAELAPGDGAPWASLAMQVAIPVFVPVALAAAAFPFGVAALGRAGKRPASRDVGWLVAAGAAGNVIGVPLSTFLLVPATGLSRSMALAAACLAFAGVTAAAAGLRGAPGRPPLRTRHAVALLGLMVAVMGALVTAPQRFDPHVLTGGPFLYAGPAAPELGDVVFAHHGVESTVTVRASGRERLLQIDGKVDATGLGDAPTQILVGALPALLAKAPSEALVIGLGTGVTVDAVRSMPSVEHVEVVELVEGVRWAAPHFAPFNGDVLADERVSLRVVDGSLLLRHGERRYDLIVSEPSNPWVAGMGDLFSEQSFRAAHDRLSEGGVFATWFHVYSTDLPIVRSIAATFAEVFPDSTLWELTRGQDYMLVGRRAHGGAELDLDLFAERLAEPGVLERLAPAGIESTEALLARLVTGPAGVLELGRGASVLSARDGSLEARAARSLYQDGSTEALTILAELSRPEASLRLQFERLTGRALAQAVPRATEAGALARIMVLRALEGDEEGAIVAGERAVGLLPDDPSIRSVLATIYLGRGKTHALVREDEQARDVLLTVLDLDPPPEVRADALTTLGDVDLRAGQLGRALSRFQAARRLKPGMPLLAERIADCLERLGAPDDAERERQLAADLRRSEPTRALR